MHEIQEKSKPSQTRKDGWLTTLLLRVEEFLDPGDAVRRRRKADRIYEDLVTERISRERAIAELQVLSQRQKGGWLLKTVSSKTLFEGSFRRSILRALQNWVRRFLPCGGGITSVQSSVVPAGEGVESR